MPLGKSRSGRRAFDNMDCKFDGSQSRPLHSLGYQPPSFCLLSHQVGILIWNERLLQGDHTKDWKANHNIQHFEDISKIFSDEINRIMLKKALNTKIPAPRQYQKSKGGSCPQFNHRLNLGNESLQLEDCKQPRAPNQEEKNDLGTKSTLVNYPTMNKLEYKMSMLQAFYDAHQGDEKLSLQLKSNIGSMASIGANIQQCFDNNQVRCRDSLDNEGSFQKMFKYEFNVGQSAEYNLRGVGKVDNESLRKKNSMELKQKQMIDQDSSYTKCRPPTNTQRDDDQSQKGHESNLEFVEKECYGCEVEGCNKGCNQEYLDEDEIKSIFLKNHEYENSIPNTPSQHHVAKQDLKAKLHLKSMLWTRGEVLGEGAYGKVFAGLNQTTGELMAVKQLKLDNPDDQSQEREYHLKALQREINLYKSIKHKHIVRYIDMDEDEESGSLYIFLEYVSGGSIQSMLERFGQFTEPLVRVYTRQLLLGLEYLHGKKLVHRDIKGGNVLVDAHGIIKLADFGASKVVSALFHDPFETNGLKSIRGSVFWMAPEVIKGDGYGRRADIWSVGCTVIEMLTGLHPWPELDNTWSAIFHIAKANGGPPIPLMGSECAKDFLQHCFTLNPKQRPTASKLLTHPFICEPLLCEDPAHVFP